MNDLQKNFLDEIRRVAIFVDDLGVDCEKSMRGSKAVFKVAASKFILSYNHLHHLQQYPPFRVWIFNTTREEDVLSIDAGNYGKEKKRWHRAG